MNLTVELLEKKLKNAHIFEVETEKHSSVVRAIRKSSEFPFAVYYFELNQNIPETSEKLREYQEHTIGNNYFQGRKSLQWNTYLYFVTNRDHLYSENFKPVKELIETDRIYARKFVIHENDIDSIINPSSKLPSVQSELEDTVLSNWIKILADAGIAKIVLSHDSITDKIKKIKNIKSTKSVHAATKNNVQITKPGFIKQFKLIDYRRYPLKDFYEFGRVNLIQGPNGSGKTSLLEAIELYYCGKNRRNYKAKFSYEFSVLDKTNEFKSITEKSRKQSYFRNCHRSWYGQADPSNSNNLYQSFARFNFLDTDAAVTLSESTSHFRDSIGKLVIGPDVSKIWDDIQKILEKLSSDLNKQNFEVDLHKKELQSYENLIKSFDSIPKDSDLLNMQLKRMLDRFGWSYTWVKMDEDSLKTFIVNIKEILSILQTTVEKTWLESPITIEGIKNYCTKVQSLLEDSNFLLDTSYETKNTQIIVSKRNETLQEALETIKQIKNIIATGILKYIEEREELNNKTKDYNILLVGFKDSFQDIFGEFMIPDLTPFNLYESIKNKIQQLQVLLEQKSKEYELFLKLKDEKSKLRNQLCCIASEILKQSAQIDECPLCHTRFPEGELLNIIQHNLESNDEQLGLELWDFLERRKKEFEIIYKRKEAMEWLLEFCDRSEKNSDQIMIQEILNELQNALKKRKEAETRIENLNLKLNDLDASNISKTTLDLALTRITQLGYPLSELSLPLVQKVERKIENDLKDNKIILKKNKIQLIGIESKLVQLINKPEMNLDKMARYISELHERLETTKSLKAKLEQFSLDFCWPFQVTLTKLIVDIQPVIDIAEKCLKALEFEKQSKKEFEERIASKELLYKKLNQAEFEITQIKAAQKPLKKIKKDYSLEKSLHLFLENNRTTIKNIFSKIHSPSEFTDIGPEWDILKRQDGTEAKLSEISTGQRAAYALSIFLAQNAQLKTAPPIMLIDDPIAHVDDLNILSFLDYLREIALAGDRQIFFATANEKVSSLFQRKFDFLEDEFKIVNLDR